MKRIGLWVVGAALLLSSCDTYTGQGAAVGGTFGSILGSAIGGIAGGWRGSDIGTNVAHSTPTVLWFLAFWWI